MSAERARHAAVVHAPRVPPKNRARAVRLPELHGLDPLMPRAVEVVPSEPVTDDDLLELPHVYDDALSFERFADGTVLVSPLVCPEGSNANAELAGQVWLWWKRTGAGGIVTESSGGFRFPDGAVLGPDATFTTPERWARRDRVRAFADVVPDAAFELLSPSDRIISTRKKIATYLRNGVRLAVLIDPERRCVYAGREDDGEPRDFGDVERLDCSPVMPGFVLDVAAIWSAASP